VSVDVIGVHAHIVANDTINVIMLVNPISDSPYLGGCRRRNVDAHAYASRLQRATLRRAIRCGQHMKLRRFSGAGSPMRDARFSRHNHRTLDFTPHPGSNTSISDSQPYCAVTVVSVTNRLGSDDVKAFAAAFASLITGLETLYGLFKPEKSRTRSSAEPSAEATLAQEPIK
jgi:hypothetical protein